MGSVVPFILLSFNISQSNVVKALIFQRERGGPPKKNNRGLICVFDFDEFIYLFVLLVFLLSIQNLELFYYESLRELGVEFSKLDLTMFLI